jgi:hypothetical protein
MRTHVDRIVAVSAGMLFLENDSLNELENVLGSWVTKEKGRGLA